MRIKSIVVEGFKSIYKEATIDFTQGGLWKISGDVGVGKTTLGECILFCLYGKVKDKNLLDLISWGAKRCKTSIELESRGHDIVINRLIRLRGLCEMEIFIDGKLLDYTNKRGGQQILEEEYFDVSKTAVETLCIISFNNFKSIVHLSSGSAETRKFIDDVFGFNIINKYIEKAKEHLTTENNSYNVLQTTISTLESQKNKYELERDTINSNIDCDTTEKLREEITSQEKLKDSITITWDAQSSSLKKVRDTYLSEMSTIKERGRKERDFINKLKSGICPLCGGRVDPTILEEHNTLLNEYLSEYKEKEKLYNDTIAELNELQSKYKKDIAEIDGIIKLKNAEISKINLQQRLMVNNYDKLISDIESTLVDKNNELVVVDSNRSKWQELYDKLYKDSRPTLLRHYVPALNSNINYYLQEMGQPYIITFDETLSCKISAFGIDNIPISNLSTGQSKLVDTAVILGIVKTLINGVNFNIFFMDELFSNAHAELREILCKMLKSNMSPDKTIYIITHAEIDDSLFDGIIKTKLLHWEGEGGQLIQNTEYNIKK